MGHEARPYHLPQGAPREALPERLAGPAEDLGTVAVGQPEHVGPQVGGPLGSREAQQHAVGAVDPDPSHTSRYSTPQGRVDVAYAGVQKRGELLGSSHRRFDEPLAVRSRLRTATV